MSDADGKGDHQVWFTTRGGVPGDTSVQSFTVENVSEVFLRRSLSIWMDKLK